MKIANTIILILIWNGLAFAQKEASIWYFGNYAGLDFNSGSPELIINSAMRAEAGCAVICNSEGKLQFYTNGKDVWNRNHQHMPNGFDLNGSQLLNQNSIIVPLPDSDSIYYLFTINAYYDSVGINYSIVNMNRDDGLGDVTLRNQLMTSGFVEKIAATEHCNNEDIWIVAHNRENKFYSYLLTSQGIFQDTIVSEAGNNVKGDIGYMKISPSSNRIAFPLNNDSLLAEVFRFDNRTGEVFEPIKIFAKDENVYAYGLEFSPDGNLLYMSTGGKNYRLWQYNLTRKTELEINECAILLAEGNHFAMQLAPDGKIYIAKHNRDYLSTINFPKKSGFDCEYQEHAISLQGNNSLMGLPNFMASLFYQPGFSFEKTCLGDTTRFLYNQYLNSDSVTWIFGDGSPSVTSIYYPEPMHYYHSTGTYNAKLTIYSCNSVENISETINIYPYPKVNLGNDTSICKSCSIELNGGDGMDFWLWQDGSESQYYDARDAGLYIVNISKNGCTTSDSITISKEIVKVTMPNAFSPNNDGNNDVFKAVYSQSPANYQLIIFDRKGRLLYQTDRINEGWDGKYRGYDCMIGVYVYKMVYSYYEENTLHQYKKKGTLVLVR